MHAKFERNELMVRWKKASTILLLVYMWPFTVHIEWLSSSLVVILRDNHRFCESVFTAAESCDETLSLAQFLPRLDCETWCMTKKSRPALIVEDWWWSDIFILCVPSHPPVLERHTTWSGQGLSKVDFPYSRWTVHWNFPSRLDIAKLHVWATDVHELSIRCSYRCPRSKCRIIAWRIRSKENRLSNCQYKHAKVGECGLALHLKPVMLWMRYYLNFGGSVNQPPVCTMELKQDSSTELPPYRIGQFKFPIEEPSSKHSFV